MTTKQWDEIVALLDYWTDLTRSDCAYLANRIEKILDEKPKKYEEGANPPAGMIQDDQEDPLEDSCVEDCLGPDDPGVGPWVFEFYD